MPRYSFDLEEVSRVAAENNISLNAARARIRRRLDRESSNRERLDRDAERHRNSRRIEADKSSESQLRRMAEQAVIRRASENPEERQERQIISSFVSFFLEGKFTKIE